MVYVLTLLQTLSCTLPLNEPVTSYLYATYCTLIGFGVLHLIVYVILSYDERKKSLGEKTIHLCGIVFTYTLILYACHITATSVIALRTATL